MPRPQRIGDILSELMAQRGLARMESGEELAAAWREAVGEFAAGASRVYWLTHETNTDARALYDKLAERSGFIQYRKLF